MTMEQFELFNKMKDILRNEEPPLDRLSDNHIMRYMQGMLWDIDGALDYLKRSEEMRREHRCNVLYEHEFTHIIEQKAFVFNQCYDRCNRPIFWMKFGNWVPAA